MRLTSLLERLAWLLIPRPIPGSDLPAVILRDLDVDTRHALLSGVWQTRQPFSFRIHPISELTEHRDRLYLATFPSLGDKTV